MKNLFERLQAKRARKAMAQAILDVVLKLVGGVQAQEMYTNTQRLAVRASAKEMVLQFLSDSEISQKYSTSDILCIQQELDQGLDKEFIKMYDPNKDGRNQTMSFDAIRAQNAFIQQEVSR